MNSMAECDLLLPPQERSPFRSSPSSPASLRTTATSTRLAEYEFWLLAGGAGLLVIGVVFRKL